MVLRSLPDCSHFPHYPQSNWALLMPIPSVWVCVYSLGLSNKLFCEAGSFSCCRLNPHRCFQSQILRLYFPALEPSVAWSVAGSTSRCLARPCPPATTLLRVLSTWMLMSTPPTGLDECVFFNFLVVGLPYSLILSVLVVFCFLNCCCPFFGCLRRHSVSTYASILAGSLNK